MQPPPNPQPPADPLTALAERSGSLRPWLFYRDGIDWQWLSHRQAAVRVARTADALQQARRTRGAVPIRLDFDVDTLVVRMAARLARAGAGTNAGRESVELCAAAKDGPKPFVPPPAPRQFESAEAADLQDPTAPFDGAESARSLFDAIRPQRSESNPETAKTVRPVVFAAPEPDLLEALASVTLSLDAGWALEPMPEAFVATARWVRPTILVAPTPALDALAEAWDDHDGKWSRLEVVVVLAKDDARDDRAVPEGRVEHWGKVFGCRVGIWK